MKNTFAFLILYCSSLFAFSQTIQNTQAESDETIIKSYVSQLDEFYQRMNGTLDHLRNPIMSNDSLRKRETVLWLFDKQYLTNKPDSFFVQINSFANAVIARKTKITPINTKLMALASTKALLNGKSIDLKVYLRVEAIDSNRYKWVMYDVDSAICPNLANRKKDVLISPLDNEVNFMVLHDISSQAGGYINSFAPAQYKPDKFAVFLYLVQTKQLKIEYVDNLQYTIVVDGYSLLVEKFNRKELNSGWLIANLQKK